MAAVISELILSEHRYLETLTFLEKKFPLSLLSLAATVAELIKFQNNFLNKLQIDVATAFINEPFEIYQKYSIKYEKSLKLLNELNKNAEFSKFLIKFNKESKLEIKEYLFLPIQKICRYPLFLTEMLKKPNNLTITVEQLQNALVSVKKAITNLDLSNWYLQNLEKTDMLFSRIVENNSDAEDFGLGSDGIEFNRQLSGGELLLGQAILFIDQKNPKKVNNWVLPSNLSAPLSNSFRMVVLDKSNTVQVYDFGLLDKKQLNIWLEMLCKLKKTNNSSRNNIEEMYLNYSIVNHYTAYEENYLKLEEYSEDKPLLQNHLPEENSCYLPYTSNEFSYNNFDESNSVSNLNSASNSNGKFESQLSKSHSTSSSSSTCGKDEVQTISSSSSTYDPTIFPPRGASFASLLGEEIKFTENNATIKPKKKVGFSSTSNLPALLKRHQDPIKRSSSIGIISLSASHKPKARPRSLILTGKIPIFLMKDKNNEATVKKVETVVSRPTSPFNTDVFSTANVGDVEEMIARSKGQISNEILLNIKNRNSTVILVSDATKVRSENPSTNKDLPLLPNCHSEIGGLFKELDFKENLKFSEASELFSELSFNFNDLSLVKRNDTASSNNSLFSFSQVQEAASEAKSINSVGSKRKQTIKNFITKTFVKN
ncbi:Phosphatidylinositol-3,4,5-trisphosphate-dependent Rac exchanger 1 protein [Lobulomyces angularis]|nr:Phosphatidylinositol-3,4,5-trisphosphate-dependent Rac exchanger 1 protein [Lobulomyces angularis]